jgi:hypothetical protein
MANAERIRSAGKDDYHIHLNFLPVDTSDGRFVIYRRKCASHLEQRPRSDASAHGFPRRTPAKLTGRLAGFCLMPQMVLKRSTFSRNGIPI